MVGIGETFEEVLELMKHLVNHGCDILTIGQYLQPTKQHLPVDRFVTPEEFAIYKTEGLKLGLKLLSLHHWFVVRIMLDKHARLLF